MSSRFSWYKNFLLHRRRKTRHLLTQLDSIHDASDVSHNLFENFLRMEKIEKIRWNRYKYQILKPFQIWQISNPLKVPFSLKFEVSNLLKTKFTSLFINTAGSTSIHNRTAKVPWNHLLFYSHAIVTADVTYCRFRRIDHH